MGTHASLLQPEVRARACFLRDEVPAETARTNRSVTDKEEESSNTPGGGICWHRDVEQREQSTFGRLQERQLKLRFVHAELLEHDRTMLYYMALWRPKVIWNEA